MAVTVQTSYELDEVNNWLGQFPYSGRRSISSGTADNAGIMVGHAVFGTEGSKILSNRASGASGLLNGQFRGVAVVDEGVVSWEGGNGPVPAAPTVYPAGVNVSYLTIGGPVWVLAGVAVAEGDAAYVTPAGVFTNVATGSRIGTFKKAGVAAQAVHLLLAPRPA